MPKLKVGTIPPVRLSDARRVRNNLRNLCGNDRVFLTIKDGGFAVVMKGSKGLKKLDGVPIVDRP